MWQTVEKLDHAYVAGLIDGEGSIHVESTKGRWFAPRMCLGMTLPALEVMQEFHAEYGGTLRIMRPATEKWAEAWMWYTHGDATVRLLSDAMPYLRIKKEHAKLAIQVWDIRSGLPRRENGQAKWTESARSQCQDLKEAVASLNRKGPRAAVMSAGVA